MGPQPEHAVPSEENWAVVGKRCEARVCQLRVLKFVRPESCSLTNKNIYEMSNTLVRPVALAAPPVGGSPSRRIPRHQNMRIMSSSSIIRHKCTAFAPSATQPRVKQRIVSQQKSSLKVTRDLDSVERTVIRPDRVKTLYTSA